ncbi:MAG: Orn/Lys/Arg decarboxylase N-terminal domain-containing protein, partial [bacterium]
MIGRAVRPFPPRALIVDDGLAKLDTSLGRATEGVARALEERDAEVVRALSFEDGQAIVSSDASLQAVLLNWDLGGDVAGGHAQAAALLEKLRERHANVPVFLLAERTGATRTITIEVAELVDEFVWLLADTSDFVAGRVLAAMERYRAALLPPYARALAQY